MLKKQISVMGVLNVTPDSFFDGGKYQLAQQAVDQALAMQSAGADIIDIGGESTRPGAAEVSIEDELQRVIPVINAIREQSDILISIDTSKPEVMSEAINAGANIINDVRALSAEGALNVACELDVPVCLMHMQGQPRSMQIAPSYDNVVQDVLNYLLQKIEACLQVGIKKENIWIDPGFGFGKTVQHNLTLLKHLSVFVETGYPVLAGLSRKSLLATLLNAEVQDRLAGSLALASIAAMNGANIIRAHDVSETVHVAKVCHAVKSAE